MKHARDITLALACSAGWLAAGCGGEHHASPAPGGPELPALAAETRLVEAGTHQARDEVVGTVRPKLRARIEAKVTGTITTMAVTPGQAVKAGDLIAALEAREIIARVEQAAAVLDQATRDLERMQRLVDQQAVTRQDFDAAQARERVARAGLDEARTMLEYTKVTAPFDGVIARKLADVGDLAAPGRALAEIEAPGTLRFEADLPEAVIDHVAPGDVMPVVIRSIGRPLDGTVSEIAPVADPATRTFLVAFDLPPVDGLRAGQFGRVAVPVGEARVLRIPEAALARRGQMETVFVVVDGVARLRIVRSGKREDGVVEILAGLDEGETVVVGPSPELREGRRVAAGNGG